MSNAINAETQSWDEERLERLLRLATSLQGSLPAPAMPAQEGQGSPDNSATRHQIESRAYQIYLQRGETPGRALEDWLQAEREVLEKPRKSDPRMRVVLAFGLLNGL
jgi:Protein of unknown function (DUF2934)